MFQRGRDSINGQCVTLGSSLWGQLHIDLPPSTLHTPHPSQVSFVATGLSTVYCRTWKISRKRPRNRQTGGSTPIQALLLARLPTRTLSTLSFFPNSNLKLKNKNSETRTRKKLIVFSTYPELDKKLLELGENDGTRTLNSQK